MGSAVSSVVGGVSNMLGSAVGGVAAPIGGALGGAAGSTFGALAQGIISAIPDVPIADQAAAQRQVQLNQNLASANAQQAQGQQNLANQSMGQTQQDLGQVNQGINQAQGAVGNAQQVNQGPNSNVNSAIGLAGQTAAGGGAAQQAARAQLQAGTNQAIASQQAMANSGNLSQMIGGQRNAMMNAATLQQQNANQAAALQAQMAAGAQTTYAGAAGQQASQAAQDAGLQQQQTAAQLQQAQQQQNLAGLQSQNAQGYNTQTSNLQGNALTGQTNLLNIQQGALSQTGQNKAQAVSGVINAAGGATGALLSDENLKENIKKDVKIKSFLDAVDPVEFEYKNEDGQNGRTEGLHLGVLAQQIEKAPGGKSMVQDTSQGKAIDIPSAVGTLLASAADLNKRLDELEELFKHKKEQRGNK